MLKQRKPSISSTKDQHVHTANNYTPGVLPQKHFYAKVSITNNPLQPLVSPLALLLANCSWKSFKSRPLALLHTPPSIMIMWMTPLSSRRQNIVNNYYNTSTHRTHIYSSLYRKQTKKGAIPFLDTLVSPGPNNILVTTLYRKPTHTDQYLHWNSNHFITAKNSVFNILACRAKVLCTSQQALHKEVEHIRKAL